MPWRNKISPVIIWVIPIIISWAGCVSGTLRNIPLSNELPPELPKEFKDNFEVKEVSQNRTPSSLVSSQTQAPETRKKKSKKSKPKPIAPAFVYPNRRPEKDPIWVGEKLTYSITYFGMTAGDFTLEVLPYKFIRDRKMYHIKGTAVTTAIFSLIYRINDMVETFIDYDGVFSHRFHILLDETKQARDSLELHDSEKSQTYYWNRWDRRGSGYQETKEFAPIPPFSQDSLSALYYVRTMPLSIGSVFSFPVISEGKSFEAVCNIVRRENMRTPLGRIDTIVIKPEMKYQGILKKSGDSYLWLTDDDRRVPVRLEAKVRIGTVIANLIKVDLGDQNPRPDPSPMPVPEPSPDSPVKLSK